MLHLLLVLIAAPADPAELNTVWKTLYGGPPRAQVQHTVTGAGGALLLPVTTYLTGEDEQPRPDPDAREFVWTIDPATGDRGPEGPALQFPEDGLPFNPLFSHIRDVAVLPGGDRLLLVGRLGLGRWRLVRRTAAGETVFEKSLWEDPGEAIRRHYEAVMRAKGKVDVPLVMGLYERSSVQLFNILPVSDGQFLLLGGRDDLVDERHKAYAVRVTADGERVWDRSYDFDLRGQLEGALLPGGRVVLTAGTKNPPSEQAHVGVLVIDAGGDVVRRTAFPGFGPSVCVTESGRPVVAAVRIQEKEIAYFARGLDPDNLDLLWETAPLLQGKWWPDSPAIVAVPGGFAVATCSPMELVVSQCGDDGTIRAVGRWGDKLMRAPTLGGAELAWEGGTLAAFWTVYGPEWADPNRSQQVGGVGFELAGERD